MLDRVSIGIKTFLRDHKLFKAVESIRRTMPEAQMIIADDGEMTEEKDGIYADLQRDGHKILLLPFDSGFGRKSNEIINLLERPFLLIFSDDFDASAPDVRVGIEKMVEVLDQFPKLSIASGRLRNRGAYEFMLIEIDNSTISEAPCNFDDWLYKPTVLNCDITFNYSLIRRNVFWTEGVVTDVDGSYWDKKRTQIGFDDEEIIGEGGHGAFFLDVKRAGLKVGYVPGVFVDEQTGRDDERYRKYRFRACGPSRKCFEKRGIKKYVLGDGRIDYEEKS